eukprot:Gb_40491 [translate_table: standard]
MGAKREAVKTWNFSGPAELLSSCKTLGITPLQSASIPGSFLENTAFYDTQGHLVNEPKWKEKLAAADENVNRIRMQSLQKWLDLGYLPKSWMSTSRTVWLHPKHLLTIWCIDIHFIPEHSCFYCHLDLTLVCRFTSRVLVRCLLIGAVGILIEALFRSWSPDSVMFLNPL